MNAKCYIVGAGNNSGTHFSKNKNEYVIAADGGLKVLERLNIIPDYIVGDFDSLGYVPNGCNVISHPVMKDDTDMMLAVEKALELEAKEIELYGGTGGRIEHTIANFQTMLYASRHGIDIKMIDEKNIYRVITDREIRLKKKEKGIFSVFALGGAAKKVTIQGALYAIKNFTLTEDNPRGISNEFTGSEVIISVKEGSLLIITES